MRCLYFDCISGISGDMTLGALIDLGVPQKYVKEQLGKLKVGGYSLRVSRCTRMGIAGRRVSVSAVRKKAHAHERTYHDIEKLIRQSTLKSHLKDRSRDVFLRLAGAEARIHNCPVEKVHFHEVGAVDSIVDIVGCVAAVDYLKAGRCFASAVPLGKGTVTCRHGTLPLPAPATLKLLEGVPVYDAGCTGELVTPTGAALLTHFADTFGEMPAVTLGKTGYGAGERERDDVPNMLRIIMGDMPEPDAAERVVVLEANIDDMNPEWSGHLMDRLFEAGALDVVLMPVHMKKNRPGIVVQAICREQQREVLTEVFFLESTTAGVRFYRAERAVLARRQGRIKTKFGNVAVKILQYGDRQRVVPEFESCRKIARAQSLPLREVYEEAARMAQRQ